MFYDDICFHLFVSRKPLTAFEMSVECKQKNLTLTDFPTHNKLPLLYYLNFIILDNSTDNEQIQFVKFLSCNIKTIFFFINFFVFLFIFLSNK